MRKNLKSKVLLTLLAASVFYLPAYANAAGLTISADTEGNPAYTATESDTADWLHKDENIENNAIYYVPAGEGAEGTESITDNTIAINSSAFAADYPNVYGAFTNESGKTLSGNTIKAGNNNGITFTNDLSKEITFKLYGAYANIVDANNYQSTAEKNSVTLNNISFIATGKADTEAAIIIGAGANLYGADKSNNSAELNKNYVAITGSTFNNKTDESMLLINGAESKINTSGKTVTATFNDNYVTINNSTVEGKYYFITGAYNSLEGGGTSISTGRSKAELTGNYVTIDGTNGGKSIIDLDAYSSISGAYNKVNNSKADSTLSNNTVNIGSAQFKNSADIHAALNIVLALSTTTANINGNAVNINNGAEFKGSTFISGATAEEKAYKKALIQNNTVNINGGTFSGNTKLFGAWGDFYGSYAIKYSDYADDEEKPASPIVLQENQVNIKDGTFSGTTDIYGACADFSEAGSAKDERANPEGKTVALTDNNVTISGGTFTNTSNIYAAYAASKNDNDHTITASLTDNSVTITGNAGGGSHDLSNVNLYGYDYNDSSIAGKITAANNNLVIDGWSGNIGSINNFANIVYENVSGDMNLEAATVNGMDSTNSAVKINSIAGGDYATTDSDATTTLATITLSSNIKSAISDTVTLGDNLNGSTWIYGDYESASGGGIYANNINNAAAALDKTNNTITVSAKVDKTILAGTVIDAKGEKHINSNGNAALTVDGSLNNTNASVIAGAYAAGDNEASGGKVYMAGDYDGIVYAGYSEGGTTGGNTAYISGGVNAASTTLLGTNKTDGTSGAALAVSGNGNTLKSIERFDTITFDHVALNKAAALTVTSADLTGTALEVASLAGGTQYHAGDKVALLDAAVITGTSNDITLADDIVQAGLAQELTVSAEQEGNSINLTVTGVGLAPQTNLVAQTRAASAAFVNQGTDLINDSLDVLGRDGTYGVKTFAAVQGNRSSYDVADDLKINGWSTIVGVGNADKFDNGSELSWGVFYENGSGNYRTYNSFNNEFFRGDGSMVYNGGGIAARYENKNGVYTEGSFRAGMLKTEMDNAMRDVNGSYGYETESAYYGAHIGVGKIISLSDSSDLDIYGKFFHTYTEGDSVTIADDKFDFDSITSDRLRVGARITSNKENKFSTYYGLAYEYEFNGDADMTAQGLRADTQSLQGSSVMAEVGFNYQPTPGSPWSFDLNMRGYAGERQGGSFNVQATYTF